jgi:SnoaL-like domain
MTERNDREEIIDLTIRYATAIDNRQYQLLSTVFTANAELDYGEVGKWTGAAEVTEFMDLAHAGATNTLHRMSNQVVAVDGDSATMRTYVDALILGPDGSGVNAIGYYDDEAVRTADGWRISKRTYTSVRLVMVAS